MSHRSISKMFSTRLIGPSFNRFPRWSVALCLGLALERGQILAQMVGAIRWRTNVGGSVSSAPAVGPDGTIYVSTDTGGVYALEAQGGMIKWQTSISGGHFVSPVVGLDGLVYVASRDRDNMLSFIYHVCALDGTTGMTKWVIDSTSGVDLPPSLGTDGTLYLAERIVSKLVAMDSQSGVAKWTVQPGGTTAIGVDGTVFLAGYDGHLYALNPSTGQKLWDAPVGGQLPSWLVIGADGTVYNGAADQTAYAFDGTTGKLKWYWPLTASASSQMSIGVDGSLLVPLGTDGLTALDGASGVPRWSTRLDGSLNSTPAVGSDGTVYAAATDGKVYALSPENGAKKWSVSIGMVSSSSPVLLADGTLVVGVSNGQVVAVETASPGPAHSAWPMFGQNSRHTDLAVNLSRPIPAQAAPQVVNGFIVGGVISAGGSGYLTAPEVLFSDPTGTGAKATAIVVNGSVTGIHIVNPGANYSPMANLTIAPPPSPPRAATAFAQWGTSGHISGVIVTEGGSGYTTVPGVQLIGGGGTGATAVATVVNGVVTAITLRNPGTGYSSAPTVKIALPPVDPTLAVAVSRVRLDLHLIMGARYQLQSSTDLSHWVAEGVPFVAVDGRLDREFSVGSVPQYYRVIPAL